MRNFGKLDMPDFAFWVGIVEAIGDVERAGRVKVRIFGYHTADKSALPTSELPYAVPINPVTSAGVNGIMESPNFVQGSTVVGAFMDGDEGQVPVIFGTIAGVPAERDFKDGQGFSDPDQQFPREGSVPGYAGVGEPDISRLARGEAGETHYSLVNRRAKIEAINEKGVPTAKAPFTKESAEGFFVIPSIVTNGDTESVHWKMPDARGKLIKGIPIKSPQTYHDPKSGAAPTGKETSLYPYNQVTETLAGIVKEYDNTPGNIRISEFHPANTWYEIHNDGSRTTYVSGSDNVVIEGDSNVFIQGNANLTVGGNLKQKVKKDYYLEVEGNMYHTVLGERHVSIGQSKGGKDEETGEKLTEPGNDIYAAGQSAHNEINGSQSNNIIGQQINTINGKPPGTGIPTTYGQVNTINNGASWIVNKADAGKGVNWIVEGNWSSKAGGGRTDEIGKAYKILARDNFILQQAMPESADGVVNEFRITTAGPASFIHEDTHTTTIKKEISLTGDLTRVDIIKGQDTLKIDNLDIMKHDDSAVDIDVTGNMNLTGTVDAEVEVKAGDPEVTLTGHVHPQTGGTGGDGDAGVDTGTGEG